MSAISNRLLSILAAALACGVVGLEAHAQVPSPVAHWTFDQGINDYNLATAIDTANGNNGTWQDMLSGGGTDFSGLGYTAGQIGGAVRLGGGGGQYFLVPSIPQIDNTLVTPDFPDPPQVGDGLTFSAWINIDQDSSSGVHGVLISRSVTDVSARTTGESDTDQLWGLEWVDNGTPSNSRVDGRLSSEALQTSASGEPDTIFREQWHHVALVWGNPDDPAGAPVQRVYIDGSLAADGPTDPDREVYELISSGSWWIGSDICSGCGNRQFDGLLDDVAIFDSPLTTAQISELYNDGLAGVDAAGVATGMITPGDTGTDGVDINDFNIILNNLGEDVTARNLGDLNGDRRVDLDDFQIWLEVAPSSLHAEAFAAIGAVNVPEPSTALLLAAACVALVGVRSRSR